jgi:gliding motility-associated-like protein
VIVTTAAGCVDSSHLTVFITPPCPNNRTMQAPNAFTPNGDGINDELCLFGWDECVNSFHMMIYDRWGSKVFETNDADFCWDGKYKGKLLDPGVYVYFINAIYDVDGATPLDKSQKEVTKKGNISLVR